MWWEGCFVTAQWKWDFRLPTDPRQTRSWLGGERGASLPLGAGGNLGPPFFSDTTLPRGSGRLETWLRKGWWIWKRKLSTWSLLMGVELHYFLRCFTRASVYCILFLPGCPFLGPSAREICLFVFLFCFVCGHICFPFAHSLFLCCGLLQHPVRDVWGQMKAQGIHCHVVPQIPVSIASLPPLSRLQSLLILVLYRLSRVWAVLRGKNGMCVSSILIWAGRPRCRLIPQVCMEQGVSVKERKWTREGV